MSARKKKKSTGRIQRLGQWSQGRGIGLILVLATATGTFVGGYVLWKRFGTRFSIRPSYYVQHDDIHITPPPRWVHSDVRREVLRGSELQESAWLFDDDLTKRIADQFLLHPWVAEVTRVTKGHPARLDVELVYRKPVAMVQVRDDDRLRPIDVEGVTLPAKDFSQVEADRYPVIAGVRSTPSGPLGTPWTDSDVQEGAAIAAVLVDDWSKLRLRRIEPVRSSTIPLAPKNRIYQLITMQGKSIAWGHAPGGESLGELTAEEKLTRLRAHLQRHRSLDTGVVRLFQQRGEEPSPRTARKSQDEPVGVRQ
jgi:hypothetical protein